MLQTTRTGRMGRRAMLGVAAAGAGALGLALAGCGSDNDSGSSSGSASPAAGGATSSAGGGGARTTTITYWGSFSGVLGEQEKAIVERFNQAQTEVNVNYQFQGSYEETAQKLTAALASNTAPDVSLLSDVWWFKFYLAGALAPLDQLFAEVKNDTKDYVPSLFNEGVRKGKSYWVPFARSTPLFYYNKDMFKAAGLPERAPETWDELVQAAPKLMNEGGAKAAFVHPGAASYIAWVFQCVIRQFGGRYSDDQFTIMIDQPNGIEAGNFYRQSIVDGWATAPKDIQVDFTTGQAASMIASTGSLAGMTKDARFNFATAPLPRRKEFNVCTGGAGLAIMNRTSDEKKLAAMKFISWVTSTEQTALWSQRTGYMPVRTSAVESKPMQDYFKENPNFKTAVEQLPRAQPQDPARVFIPNGDQIIGKGLEEIVINRKDAKDAFGPVAATLRTDAKPITDQLKKIEG
jgi:sn-glycerol 3-phosphate transport system substrate-binding protein